MTIALTHPLPVAPPQEPDVMRLVWKNMRLLPGWAPGLATLLNYQRAWLMRDLVAALR